MTAKNPDTGGTQQTRHHTNTNIRWIRKCSSHKVSRRYGHQVQDFLKIQMVEYKPRGITLFWWWFRNAPDPTLRG